MSNDVDNAEIVLFGIASCTTVKKARNWLDDHGIQYRFYDYKKSGLSADQIDKWIAHFGWEVLINRRGTTWRRLPENVRTDIKEESARAIMRAHTSIIKRPIVEYPTGRLIGFDESAYSAALL